MNYRSMAAIILVLVVGFEMYSYLNYVDPVEQPSYTIEELKALQPPEKGRGEKYTVDDFLPLLRAESQQMQAAVLSEKLRKEHEKKSLITIAVTIAVGFIVIFAVPSNSKKV